MKIPIPDPNFFEFWVPEVKPAFEERRWSKYFDESPTVTKSNNIDATPDENSLEPHTDALAKAFLARALPRQVGFITMSCRQKAEFWSALSSLYRSGTANMWTELYKQLSEIKKVPGQSIDEHILKFNKLVCTVDSARRRRMPESEVIEFFEDVTSYRR